MAINAPHDHIAEAFELADLGYWQLDFTTNEFYWSDKVKELHGVASDYEPTLEEAVRFYKAGEHRKLLQQAIETLKKSGEPYDLELLITPVDGEERWVRTCGKARFEEGECKKIYGSIQDIHRQKTAENQLEQTEHKLRDIVEHSTNMFYRHDTDHQLTYVSPQAKSFLGYTPEEVKQKWTDFFTAHPVNDEGLEITKEAIRTGETQPPFELQLEKADGDIIWVKANEAPIVEDGETVAIVGALTDITKQKEREERLNILSRVARETQNIVIITNPNQEIEWVNEAFTRNTGYDRDEVYGKVPGDILQGEDTDPETVERISEQLSQNESLQEEILNYTKDGTPYWVKLQITPIFDEDGELVRFFSIQEEITEQKRSNEELKRQNRRLQLAQEVGAIGDWWYDVETEEIGWSPMMFEIYERDPEQGVPNFENIMFDYTDDSQFHMEKIQRALEYGESYSFDIKKQTEKGNTKYVHIEGMPYTNEDGKVTHLHGTVQEITERKQAEMELRKEKELSNAILDSLPGLFYMIEVESMTYVRVNDNFLDLLDVEEEEVSDLDPLSSLKDDEKERVEEELRRIIEEGFGEIRTTLDLDGEEYYYYLNGRLFLSEGKKYIIGSGIDISEQVETQRRNEILLQEVHHRVKNNLAVVSGLLRLELDNTVNEQNRLPLERSINRIQSIAKVHDLLYKRTNFSSIYISEYIPKLVEVVRGTFEQNEGVTIDTKIDHIEMNVNEAIPLGMLLNELLTNSMKYAFPDQNDGNIRIEVVKNDHVYNVLYRDDGIGLDGITDLAEVASVGLYIVYTLLKQLDAEYELKTDNQFCLEFSFGGKTKGSHANVNKLEA